MKPKKLEFKGLKSYINTCSIDFDELSRGGLFGIFGDTGSGKSTILDGVFLALYGRLPASNSVTDFINKTVGYCTVDFSFEIYVENVRKTFGVRREYKLKGDRKSVPQPKAVLFEIVGGEEMPIAEDTSKVNAKIQEIVGLDISDFQKCIVLPQGQFSAFVTMQRGQRLSMVSGLFNLEKYGERLEDELKKKQSALSAKLLAFNEGLAYYANDTFENLKSTEKHMLDTKVLLDDCFEKYSKNKEYFSDFKENYDRCKNLEACEKQVFEKQKSVPLIEEKQLLLEEYKKAAELYSLLDDKQKIQFAIRKAEGEYSAINVDLEKLKLQLSALEEEEKDEPKKTARVVEINTDLALLEGLKDDFDKNEKRQNELKTLRLSLKQNNELFSSLTEKLNGLRERLKGLENSDEVLSLPKRIQEQIDKIIAVAKSVFVKEEIEFLNSLTLDASSALSKTLQSRISALSAHLDVEGGDSSTADAVKTLNVLYSFSDNISAKKLGFSREISKTEGDISLVGEKISAVTQKGVDLKKEWDETAQKIERLTKGEKLDVLVDKLKKERQTILDGIEKRKEKTTALSARLSSLRESLSSKEGEITEKKSNLLAISEKIDAKRKEFKDEKSAERAVETIKDYDKELKQVEDFWIEYRALLSNKEKLEKAVGERRISDGEFEKEKENSIIIEKNYLETDKNYFKLTETYENLSQNFAKRCKIEKEISGLEKEKLTVDKLFEAIKGKKFLEFIADEYLTEIAKEARSILLDVSGGKYGLKYQGEFFIEDNFRGGILRKVDTVSGGELFLLSLSLSLALSKSICQKSSRPIEFFFLDEGFGALDSNLLQVVMDSLDKLKNSSFTIGVISHVEALKERIPAKINVTAGEPERGSSVTITV